MIQDVSDLRDTPTMLEQVSRLPVNGLFDPFSYVKLPYGVLRTLDLRLGRITPVPREGCLILTAR